MSQDLWRVYPFHLFCYHILTMKNRFIPAFIALTMAAQPLAVFAQTDSRGFEIHPDFNPSLVLADSDVYELGPMSYPRLVAFMRSKGALADIMLPDIDGLTKPASEIVWRVANTYRMNPQFLLMLLQKEQSLVEDPAPTERQLDWATGFGVCDDCSKDDPSISDFKGFANQLEYAAKQMRDRYYMRVLTIGHTGTGLAPGRTTLIDGITVVPANIATAALYSYTPHIHGNQNAWKIWNRWFTRHFPNGTAVRGTDERVWWIRNGEKRPFASTTVASTMIDLEKIVDVGDAELSAYAEGQPINFPNYALLKEPDGRIWLIVDDERRHITDMASFRAFGFNMDEVEEVTPEEIQPYTVGEPITTLSQYPQGQLLEEQATGQVWYAENGTRHLISDAAILGLYFKARKPKKVESSILGSLKAGEPYGLRDGELVKSPISPAVFVIEHGQRRSIPDGDTFEGLGWKWKNIVTIPEITLINYPEGAPILLDGPATQLAAASSL
ncbi:MAG: conserved secreted protein [Candidatus Parcubacteria bacterium]|jgi:hypothetical protein